MNTDFDIFVTKACKYMLPRYCKCPKITYTKVSDKMAYAKCADPDQTAPIV